MLSLRFDIPFFQRGDFPTSVSNASQEIVVPNPWTGRGNSAPFDQRMLQSTEPPCTPRFETCFPSHFSLLSYPRRRCWRNKRLVPRQCRRQAVAERSAQSVLLFRTACVYEH